MIVPASSSDVLSDPLGGYYAYCLVFTQTALTIFNPPSQTCEFVLAILFPSTLSCSFSKSILSYRSRVVSILAKPNVCGFGSAFAVIVACECNDLTKFSASFNFLFCFEYPLSL